MQFHTGCSGWYYDAWLGHFYSSNLEQKEFLKYYIQAFDFVEIDSSSYYSPKLFIIKRWTSMSSDDFRFTDKFRRSITHENDWQFLVLTSFSAG
ncbi:MAG TPA: DUF72 domain-containing protein [Nitrososphaera sp.]|nr:DUF72 domain-containing protein [Nitrososphaera sp.]